MPMIINRAGWLVAGVLALFVVAAMTGVVRGGPLDPGGPASSTLPQVEPRSPIPPVGWNGTFPIVISVPGSYFLTRSLAVGLTNTDAIQIVADDVSIDLNRFTLGGFDRTGSGVSVTNQHSGIKISNGVVRHWKKGISAWWPGGQAVYSRVDSVTALDNDYGILLGFDSEIVDCNVSANGTGIQTHYGVVRRCHVTDNTSNGIYVEDFSRVEENVVFNNGYGIYLGHSATVGGNTLRSNTSTRNSVADIYVDGGSKSIAESNVVTCPASFQIFAGAPDFTAYDTRYLGATC